MRYGLRRLLAAIPTWFGVITLSFLFIHIIPGDPTDIILGERATDLERLALREKLGLTQPLWRQYFSHATDALRLEFGRSIYTNESVSEQIFKTFAATFELASASLILAILIGLTLGLASAARHPSLFSRSIQVLTVFFASLPGVVLGPLLVYVFAIRLEWFPVSERGDLSNLILPAISLALPLSSVLCQMTRVAALEVLHEDYIRTANAKGLPKFLVYFRHVLKPALSPIITVIGLQAGAVLTGTVITETIFDWPGLGSLLYSAILNRDYPIIQGVVAFIAGVYIVVNFLTDLAYGAVNPTVRVDR